ncbi:hypothetical protein ABHM93_03095 [Micromonospora provocatoris]|uniref:MerR family transcriptional regulator n=1 Tax=Micromonospora provocatoris TaxID=322610 RepID=UPI003D28202A
MSTKQNIKKLLPIFYRSFRYKPSEVKSIKRLLNICDKLNLSFEKINDEFFIESIEYKILNEALLIREQYFNNEIELYSSSEVANLLGVSSSQFKHYKNIRGLNIKTVMNRSFYFDKKEVDDVRELLKNTYSLEEIINFVREETIFYDISRTMVRLYINRYFEFSPNPVDKYDWRINKNDKEDIVRSIKNNYKPKKSQNDYKEIMIKFAGGETNIKYVDESRMERFLDKSSLREYTKQKYLLINGNLHGRRLIEHVITICNMQNIEWLTNIKFSNIYILVNSLKVYLEYYEHLEYVISSYYSSKEVKGKFGRNDLTLVAKYAESITIGNVKYFKKQKIHELEKIYKDYVKINEIAKDLKLRNVQVSIIANKLGLKTIDGKGIPYMEANELIAKKDIPVIKEYVLKKESINNAKNNYEKFILSIQEFDLEKNLPKTTDLFDKYVKIRLNRLENSLVGTYIKIYHNILINLNKEIIEYRNSEITTLFTRVKHELAKREFAFFLNYCKESTLTKYDVDFTSNQIKGPPTEPYDFQQWFDFGYLLFNKEQPLYSNYIEKALKERANAMVWLYCSMHYVCGWRATDIITVIPQIPLEVILDSNEEEVLQKIKSNSFTEEMAQKIVNFVMDYINRFRIKPSKTKRRRSTPPLKLVVEKGYVFQIGLLMALCESHRRIIKKEGPKRLNTNHLMTDRATIIDAHILFFGDEYKVIFKEEGFYNRRANATFMGLIQKISQNKGWGIGYQLASIFRSHKSGRQGLATSTEIYLESINKNKDLDEVSQGLVERGTFGFIPYLMAKMLLGEELIQLDLEAQNRKIQEVVPFNPPQVERLLTGTSLNSSKVKSILEELLITKNENMLKVLRKIIKGDAPSKMEYSQCLLKCIDLKACIDHKRTDCIGCDYFIPEMYFLLEYKVLLDELLVKIRTEKNEFDKVRFSHSLVSVFLPILQQAINILGKERVNAFINVKVLKEKIKILHDDNHLLLR